MQEGMEGPGRPCLGGDSEEFAVYSKGRREALEDYEP